MQGLRSQDDLGSNLGPEFMNYVILGKSLIFIG